MVNCTVCGREFDERGYQLVVPGRAESFDSFECAARAQGLPWLGPSSRSTVGAPPFERPVAAAAPRSALSAVVPELARVRTRAGLAGAAALVVAVGAASAYLWLRDADTSADARPSPGARVVGSGADAPPIPSAEERGEASGERDEASGATTESRPGRDGGTLSEGSGARPPRGDAALPAGPGDRPAPSKGDADADVVPVPDSPRPSRPPRQDPPLSSPTPPPRSPVPAPPPAARPPAPVTVPAPSAATRPGWGHGDKKHAHSGPPGAAAASPKAAKKPRPGRQRR